MFFLRSVHEGDLPAIQRLLRETWHATYDSLIGPQEVERMTAKWHSLDNLRRMLERKSSEFILADDGESIAGVAYAALDGPDMIDLKLLYVLPAHQRQGIGRDLFAEIETCFDGARRLRVAVHRDNRDGIAFYQAHGLTRLEEAGPTSDGKVDVTLQKELDFHVH